MNLLPLMVNRQVVRYPKDPGPHVRYSTAAVEMTVQPQEDLLRQIFCIRRITENSEQVSINGIAQ